jgi:hypothetical protein
VSSSDGPTVFVVLVIAAIALWYGVVRDSDWLAKVNAKSQYGVPISKIQIVGNRPHDCEFMTAPLGEKHCSYKGEYRAEWFTLSKNNEPIVYGTNQESPPTACSSEETDFAHRCYRINDLGLDEHPTAGWRARSVEIRWRKVEE